MKTCFINLKNGEIKKGIPLPFPLINYFPSIYNRRFILLISYPKMGLLLPKTKEWMTFSINIDKFQIGKYKHISYRIPN